MTVPPTPSRRAARRLAAVTVAASAVLGACASDGPRVATGPVADAKVDPGVVPSSLLGYATTPEDVSAKLKEAGDKAYVSDVRFWSVREGERLRATLEVARFAPDAPDTDEFRRRVADQIGSAAPRVRRIGDELVYVSAGNRQTYYLWYRGRSFVLLGVPADAPRGRALLREALGTVQP